MRGDNSIALFSPANPGDGRTQKPAIERDDLLKSQQQREMTYSKASKRERGVTQNPARERNELLKSQQERERSYSKASKRER